MDDLSSEEGMRHNRNPALPRGRHPTQDGPPFGGKELQNAITAANKEVDGTTYADALRARNAELDAAPRFALKKT